MSANEGYGSTGLACYFYEDARSVHDDGCARKRACNGGGFGWPAVARIMIIIRWRDVVVAC